MKVYRYGCKAPHQGVAEAREQLRLAGRFYNTLIEIERGRRAAVRAAEAEPEEVRLCAEACRAAVAEFERLRDAARAQRRAARARKLDKAKSAALTQARAVAREAARVFSEARAAHRPAMQAEMDRVSEVAKELRKIPRVLG